MTYNAVITISARTNKANPNMNLSSFGYFFFDPIKARPKNQNVKKIPLAEMNQNGYLHESNRSMSNPMVMACVRVQKNNHSENQK
nr:hypothetical protein [Muriicola soli]